MVCLIFIDVNYFIFVNVIYFQIVVLQGDQRIANSKSIGNVHKFTEFVIQVEPRESTNPPVQGPAYQPSPFQSQTSKYMQESQPFTDVGSFQVSISMNHLKLDDRMKE